MLDRRISVSAIIEGVGFPGAREKSRNSFIFAGQYRLALERSKSAFYSRILNECSSTTIARVLPTATMYPDPGHKVESKMVARRRS